MNYKITKSEQRGETLETTIEFTYKDIVREVIVAHFQPNNIDTIHIGISNRIASEIRRIDATDTIAEIQLTIGEEKVVNYTPAVSEEENPLSGYSVEELKQQITILSEEYNYIMEQRNIINSQLQDNSSKYDLLIEELAKRV